MSEEKLRYEAERWLRQARDDLQAADVLFNAGRYAQTGFWAQQAAEKALNAVWIAADLDPWGHSITRLIKDMPESMRVAFEAYRDQALYLDKLYIPTRYPDALADLIPAEAYTREEVEQARAHAATLLSQVERWFEE